MQFNCNGIRNSHLEISRLLQTQLVLVACLQETKLSSSSPPLPPFPNHTIIRRDRPGSSRGGGLITLVHHSIPYTVPTTDLFPHDSTAEHLSITATINSIPIHIHNIYIPPTSSCPSTYTPSFTRLFQTQDDTLILGDFNAHHPAWYSQTSDTRAAGRGEIIHDTLTDSDLVLLNTDSPTRLPSDSNPTSPDLSISTPHIAIDSEWSTLTTLNSDHLPIFIQLGRAFSMTFPEPPRRTFTNFRKARWDSYTWETEERFSNMELPSSCSTGEGSFRRVLTAAAHKHIPRGNIPHMIPNLTDSAKRLIDERDSLRRLDPTNPYISTLDEQITQDIHKSNRQTWIDTVESCSHKHNATHFFRLIKTLSGSRTPAPPNQPITFNSTTHTRPLAIATAFNKQFTSVTPHTSDPLARRVKRRLIKAHPLDTSLTPFTPSLVSKAIRDSGNSRAAGPDGLTIHHLKYLGPSGIIFLTHLFNLSYRHADIPAIWKSANIIPIPKAGKPADLGTSYRPISLLSPTVKVLERLLLPELRNLPLSNTQHGFRPHRSTTTALLPLIHKVVTGFNQRPPPHRTVTVSLDFSKAFDTVNHTKLLDSLTNTTLRHNTVRWLSAYLKGRMTSCRYNNTNSPYRHMRTGVPQGSCISPALFNHYVHDYPHSDHLTSSYADDFTDSHSHPDYNTSASALTDHATRVSSWAEQKGLSLSAPKSTVSLFTSWTRQTHCHPQVTLNSSLLPLAEHPRILGVTFDPHLTFSRHIASLISRATPRLNILRALAGTSWGQSKETLIITYKSLIHSLFTYAAPTWFPNTSPSYIQKLQRIQNTALRISTGCVKMSPIDHLHAETQVLPVQDHLTLLCSQFLARALQPSHVSHPLVTSPPSPRNIKHTLHSKFHHLVAPYTVGGIIPPDTYTDTLKFLHTGAVARAIASRSPNKVLLTSPPVVAEEEKLLPRRHRSVLSQLRSGYSSSLNSFLERVGRAPDPLCPSCRGAPHTPAHIFICPSHPTSLTVTDLWTRPGLAIGFLSSLPFFDLPPVSRPPPEPLPPPL